VKKKFFGALITVVILIAGLSLAPPGLGATPTVFVSPDSKVVQISEQFTIDIDLDYAEHLYGFEIFLTFDRTKINATAIQYVNYFNTTSYNVWYSEINNTAGYTTLAVSCLAPVRTGKTGGSPPPLASINFTAIAAGSSTLHLQPNRTILSDDQGIQIASTTLDGNVQVAQPTEQVLDVYTQRGGIGPNTSSDAFSPAETVIFSAYLKYQGQPISGAIVQFTTYDPDGTPRADTARTDNNGIATSNFTLSSDPIMGNYSTTASANVQGQDYNDTVIYRVGWIVCLQNVIVCNYSGTPLTSFDRGTRVYVNVTLENISFTPKTLFLWVHAWDNNAADVAREWMLYNVPSGKTTVLLGFRIPQWSARGDGQLYVGAYNNPYWTGGSAYCPGIYSSLQITGS